MDRKMIARAQTTVNAPPDRVWEALVTPKIIKEYMFGTDVASDFKEGSAITWKGEWKGKAYEDKGRIMKLDRGRTLQYTHFSPLAGLPDKPENYHTVTIELSGKGTHTDVSLSQDNNATEKDKQHSEENWKMMLEGLKKVLEKRN